MIDWFGTWGRAKKGDAPAMHERAFRRRGLAAWDARWHELTPEARSSFVNEVKGPARNQADHAPRTACRGRSSRRTSWRS